MNLAGLRFNRLLVISLKGMKGKRKLWECECDCGNKTLATTTALNTGVKKSCGCLAKETLLNRCVTHGLTGTKIYKVWESMISRCHNLKDPSYNRYGGRGIFVCAEWRSSLKSFHEFMGNPPENKTLDRINNNEGYIPGNCRWATYETQARNRSNSKIWYVKGYIFETCTLAANYFDVSHQSIINWCNNRKDCNSVLRYK